MTTPSERPAYLGKVLDDTGSAVGTCFQVRPGVLVTSWHVLDDLGAGSEDAQVRVAPFTDGMASTAIVRAVDPLRDLAVLITEAPFRGSVAGLVASESVQPTTKVAVIGVALFPDTARFQTTSTTGEWQGTAVRENQVALGQMDAASLVPGMSGAPVRRVTDDMVVGVVFARYNSAGSRMRDTVWVARTEDLRPLLAVVADVPLLGGLPRGVALDLTLTVDEQTVRLAGAGVDVTAQHGGIRPGLANAVQDVRRERALQRMLDARDVEAATSEQPGSLSLRRAGELLADSYLPEPVSKALASVLDRATQETVAVRLGVDAPKHTALPWEALPDPKTGTPLALHPLVSLYRTGRAGPPAALPGPLRIVVAIASPEVGGGPVLDYERELGAVLDAVRAARQSDAEVQIVPFATTAAIRAALDGGGVHVLHLSAHGAPGVLHLEDEEGRAAAVTAERFVIEAVPPNCMPPVISLAACYTDAAGEHQGPSFAAQLAARGACAVIGTQTSVTDRYATRLFARVYTELAQASSPDVINAVADARRAVQRELVTAAQPLDRMLAGLDEWSVVTVLAGAPQVPVLDRTRTAERPEPEPLPDFGSLLARPTGQFVGRRDQQRRLPAVLEDHRYAGVLLHGIGGVGKTTLAAEVLRRAVQRRPGARIATTYGALSVDAVLAQVAAALRPELLRRGIFTGPMHLAVQVCERMDVRWQDRLALLREHVLGGIPLFLVLDNFEDNLAPHPGDPARWVLTDPTLAELLGEWIARPGRSRFLITSRHRFPLPGAAQERLHHHQVPPMTLAETRKLLWALPNLENHAVDAEVQDQIWRALGGHPRSLEYLDALLGQGRGRFDDITRRLETAVQRRLDSGQAELWLRQERTLDAALAEVVTLAADDVLLTDHLERLSGIPGSIDLLLGISVYREPVDVNAMLFQVGLADEDAAYVPDRKAIVEQIEILLQPRGLTIQDLGTALGPASPLTRQELYTVQSLVEEYQAEPRPPRRPPATLRAATQALLEAGLITALPDGQVSMHRWTATALHDRWHHTGAGSRLVAAEHAAAAYWQWRVSIWPQDEVVDIHDLVEARYHLLSAGDVDAASTFAEYICSALHRWGAWDRETAVIHDTLRLLSPESPRCAVWYHQLGMIAQQRGDYTEAEQRYRQALTINEQLDNQVGLASGYHQLGMIAQQRGDYTEAEQRYRQALTIKEQLGDQAGLAASYHQLGRIAQLRGEYAEAEQRYRQALTIKEQLGDQAGLASSYHQLGMIAQLRDDYTEAEQRYRQALTINEQLGNRAGLASGYHQLGRIAQLRDDFTEAERLYHKSLTIEEELGNQAGLASSHHQLGIIADIRGDYTEAEHRYRQALTIREQIGDQAGLAASYHQLGMIAHVRDDYTEAEHLYRQSLTISDRIGDPVAKATTLSQLANLRMQLGDMARGVTLHCEALVLRLAIRSSAMVNNLQALFSLRADLDRSVFDQAAGSVLGDDFVSGLHSTLDTIASLPDSADQV